MVATTDPWPQRTAHADRHDIPWHGTRGSRRARTFNSSMRATIPGLTTGFGLRALQFVGNPSARQIRAARPVINEAIARLSPVPRGTTVHTVRERHGVRGEWVHGRGVGPGGTIVYYLHGSGYVLCSPRTHRGLVSRMSSLTGLPAFSLDYRLAPEHHFPSAGDDAIAGYHWLLDKGYSADRIVLAGDSAGGHLALDLLAHNHRHGIAQPRAMVLFSPLSDPTFGLCLARQQAGHRDPLIDARLGAAAMRHYLADADPAHPRLAVALTAEMALPPKLIQVGSLEVMVDDAHDVARRITDAGGRCALQVWPDQSHVFQLFPGFTPEATRAVRAAASFISGEVDQTVVRAAESVRT